MIGLTLVSIGALFVAGCGQGPAPVATAVNQATVTPSEPAVDYERAARLNLELGLNYMKEGYVERAKSKFNRALNLAPNLSEAHMAMGYYHEQVGEIDKAATNYAKGVDLDPKSGKARNNYGVFLCRQQRYAEAEKQFKVALQDSHYVNTAELLENAGLCTLPLTDRQVAAQYFEKALQYDPHRASALLELAWLNWQDGKADRARHYYSRFQKVGKPNPRALKLGIALAKAEGDKNKEASLRLMLNASTHQARL